MNSNQKSNTLSQQKLWVRLLAFALLALLFYLKPRIESWVQAQQQGPNAIDSTGAAAEQELGTRTDSDQDSSPEDTDDGSASAGSDIAVAGSSPEEQKPAAKEESAAAPPKKKRNDSPIRKMERTPEKKRPELTSPEKNNPPPGESDSEKSPELGKLKEVDENVFESSAGLLYVPGGAEGHRLKHVMQHAKDNPSKPLHGVFDGDRDQILAVIDEAFLKAKKGGSDVRSEKQNGRRVFTVNLGRRIGEVGGSQGERQGRPECRFVRIVLENENEVVSAYPSKSF